MIGLYIIAVIATFILTTPIALWINWRIELARLPTAELEHAVFDCPEGYFRVIGANPETVVEFRQLARQRNLEELIKQWPRISKDFRSAERHARPTGRPLYLDYIDSRLSMMRELRRRNRKPR
ncbi:MAG TPA: hypothetical protein P5171_07635 [Xanthomonadaceae bacterium]|nr:hypothetical protein [Xanthomonadales bacterium]HPF72922.1 hypothetical protein [Xanthomonadaceae bacterium]HRX99981.1 hypothetical protein [Xanthomonadaceae bacterium]